MLISLVILLALLRSWLGDGSMQEVWQLLDGIVAGETENNP